MSHRLSVTVDDGIERLVDGLVRASGESAEVPVLSQARVLRLLIRRGAADLAEDEADPLEDDLDVDGETLKELIPDHALAKYLREDLKDESWLVDMRGGFEGRVRRELRKRFKSGYDPDELDDYAETFAREAYILWGVVGDDDDRLDEAVEFVDEKVEEYREAHETTDYDPDEEWLSLEGVERGREHEEKKRALEEVDRDAIAAEARDRFVHSRADDPEAIADSIANTHGVDRELVREIVGDVEKELTSPTGAPADD